MRFATCLTVLTIIAASAASARAGAALDDDKKPDSNASPTRTTDPNASPDNLATGESAIEWGADLRVREVFVPSALLGLFVDHSPGGASNTGIGVDLVRRRGTTELQLGFEYEHINAPQGTYINKGDTVPANDPDYILSPDSSGHNFGWFTIEFTFINNAPINKWVAFRYGAGLGIGILNGEIDHYNIRCASGATNANPEPACLPQRFGGQGQYTDPNGNIIATEKQYAYNTYSPIYPVLNGIIGFQFKPTPKAVINIEGGIRTLPFIGFSAGYFY
jgi:hypothetical protein